jgi:hypothetical protein
VYWGNDRRNTAWALAGQGDVLLHALEIGHAEFLMGQHLYYSLVAEGQGPLIAKRML